MIKILSIGNSFSEDAQRWLFPLAAAGGKDCVCANLYIGGCSLEHHRELLFSDAAEYALQINATHVRMVTLREGLESERWDIITFQQASHFSGKPDTYRPYLAELAAYARQVCPDAKLCFHQTWAYETDSDHPAFADYECDQKQMYEALCAASATAADEVGLSRIPAGDVIQYLRENEPLFDYRNGGLSLCRDGFHMSWDYGRYAVAATWYTTLLGGDIIANPYRPPMADGGEADEACIDAIKRAVKHICG